MITQLLGFEDGVPFVVGIEVEVKRVNHSGALVMDDDCTARCVSRLPSGVWRIAVKPLGSFGEVVSGSEVDIFPPKLIQLFEVGQGQRGWCAWNFFEIDCWVRMGELVCDV